MARGRPTSYNPSTVAKAVSTYVKLRQQKLLLPTIEGLAVHLSVARDTLYEWAKQHEDFSDILEALMAAQADQLVNNGLVGVYNSTITKLMLTKHGYTDKQDITSGGEMLPTPILASVPDHE